MENNERRPAWPTVLILLAAAVASFMAAAYLLGEAWSSERTSPQVPTPESRPYTSDKTRERTEGSDQGTETVQEESRAYMPPILAPRETAAGSGPTPTPPPLPETIVEGQWLGQKAGRPMWLTVPAADISAAIEGVGLTDDQTMATPSDWANAGWFELGYVPGQPGTSVISGHLDAPGGREAVFWDLDELEEGDQIRVEMDNGVTYLYRVERSLSYPYDDAPMEEIFAWSAEPRLSLITCQGEWNRKERSYDRRLVVYAQYVGEVAGPGNGPAEAEALGRGVAGSP